MLKGEIIRAKRESLKLTVKELSSMIQVSEANLYKWEKGTKISDPEAYLRLKGWLENVPHETDLQKALKDLREWQATVDATLAVLSSELVPIISKITGKSNASVFSQLQKDIEEGTSTRRALINQGR